MTDNFRQVLEIAKHLSYEEIEALYTMLHSINYERKEKLKAEAQALLNA